MNKFMGFPLGPPFMASSRRVRGPCRVGPATVKVYTKYNHSGRMPRKALCDLVKDPDAKTACRIMQRKKIVWLSDLVAQGMSVRRANRAIDLLIRRGLAKPAAP